jgi:hypothetical protein
MILLRSLTLDDGQEVVNSWYARANAIARANLDVRMNHLRFQKREGWTRPYYDILRKADGVGEVRFKAEKINHRALGYFGPGRNEFTFLFFSTKTDRYDPPNAIEIAKQRRLIVVSNPRVSTVVKRWGQK